MIQLGCNLKCNYCYAVEGTYRRETNPVMTDETGIAILDSIVNKGIRQIEHISFLAVNQLYTGKQSEQYVNMLRLYMKMVD